ncbi:MAG TPA: hypothetical protein VLQ45_13120 [Thermoanaerobaculia bacterium]|nr:hypothetical protein [Thermoanaerobaculia bacterium]
MASSRPRGTGLGALLGGLGLLLGACGDRHHDPDRFSPTSPGVVNALVVTADRTSLVADGSSTTVLTATISPLAAEDRRTVTFKTSTGTFIGASTPPTELTVLASRGVAKATLQSSRKVEVAAINVTVKDDAETLATFRLDIPFVAAGSEVLQLEVTPPSIPADGFSRATLVATVGADVPSDRRTVVFTASKGQLVNGSGTPSTLEVVAGRDNKARAELISSRSLETAIVEASLKDVPGAIERATVRFDPLNPADVIQLSTSVTEAPADGATILQVTATVASGLAGTDRQVTFTTTRGTFPLSNPPNQQTIQATADASNRATVDLKAGTELDTAVIRATVAGVTAETRVRFVPALPDFIVLKPDSLTLKADNTAKVHLVAELRRSLGHVTRGTVVQFSAVIAGTTTPVDLIYRNVTPSDANDEASADVFAPASAPKTTVTLLATVPGGAVGRANIQIVP